MKNFEVQHTIRLYEPELIAKISRAYDIYGKDYRNKNEFMTELLRRGVNAMLTPPTTPDNSAVPPAALVNKERIISLLDLLKEISEYITIQHERLNRHIGIIERLISALYHIKIGELNDCPLSAKTVEDGLYDDLPLRFEKILLTFKNSAA